MPDVLSYGDGWLAGRDDAAAEVAAARDDRNHLQAKIEALLVEHERAHMPIDTALLRALLDSRP